MTEAGPSAAPSLPRCPRCSTPLPEAWHADTVTCPGCGSQLPTVALAELQSLTSWAAWADARADWLRARLVAGDLPAEGWSALGGAAPLGLPGAPVAPAPTRVPARPRATAGTLLLAGGAALLVLAGIAFVAFAWDLLGPTGQLATLYSLGALALLAGVRLRGRLPGTATTLGVVGALLVAVSTVATRVLAPDVVGESAALLLALTAAAALAAAGVVLRSRMHAVAEVAALVGGTLVLGLAATAPARDALPLGDRWTWWPALVLLVGGVALLLLAHRFGIRTWPPLAAAALFLGSLLLAGYAADRVTPGTDELGGFTFSLVLLALAVLQALLAGSLPGRRPEPAWTAATLGVIAVLVSLLSGQAVPAGRPWSALALAVAAGLVLWARTRLPAALRAPAAVLAAAVLGAAVGYAVAPWTEAWAPWRGLLAGSVLAALLVGLAEADRRVDRGPWSGLSALAATTAGLAVWVAAVAADHPEPTDAVLTGVAVALFLPAAAGWVEAVRRGVPAWSVWLSGAAVAAASVLLLVTADVDSPAAPEAVALALAWGAAVSGALCWWVRRPERTPTLVTVAPALTLVLTPTTWAMVVDATDRWWWGEDPGTAYQVRVVALFVVGAGLVVLGAWRRLAGVVAPAAAALLVVTAVQLVELGRFLPQWVSFGVAGGLLVAAGARWESVRRVSREGSTWARHLH